MNKRVLSFDISSSTIGYCILDIIGGKVEHVFSSTWNPPKEKSNKKKKTRKKTVNKKEAPVKKKPVKEVSIYEVIDTINNKVVEIMTKYNPTNVVIEDYSKRFMEGRSSATTIILLSLINRLVGYAVYKCGITPVSYNVLKIRHGIKIGKVAPSKLEMPEFVQKILGKDLGLTTRKTPSGKEDQSVYDEADSIAVGLYFCKLELGKLL